MEAHRNLFLLSPHLFNPFSSPASRLANSTTSSRGRSKSRDPSPYRGQGQSPGSPEATSVDPRSRKMATSVFNMGRVFSNLMGRGSLPPDLPSSGSSQGQGQGHSSSGSAGFKERGLSTDRLSLKKVFKKRSV